jgi:hypothetical protein
MVLNFSALHIAIDVGTAYSGFASSMQIANDVALSFQYPDQPAGYVYCKQPSAVLYRKLVQHPTRRAHYQFITTGYTADIKHQQVCSSVLMLVWGSSLHSG